MTTMYGAPIDMIADGVLRDDVTDEVKRCLDGMRPMDLTACELFGLLAILRPAKERLDAQQRPAAPVLELRAGRKSSRAKRRGSQ
jgi:hypothetical protein